MEAQIPPLPDDKPHDRYVQVAVFMDDTWPYPFFSVDPWDNCPFQVAREEERSCDECEFWGRRVESEGWIAFSLCLFEEGKQASVLEDC
jgi:hypothetical protein